MATASVRSTTNPRPRVVAPAVVAVFMASLARHTGTLKTQLAAAFSRTTRGRARVPYAQSMQKAVLSGKQCKAVEIVTALLMDLAHDGRVDDGRAVAQHFAAIVEVEYATTHPAESRPQLSVREAHLLEERCEGACDEAEAAMAHEPTLTNYLRYQATSAALSDARRQLDAAVQREAATL